MRAFAWFVPVLALGFGCAPVAGDVPNETASESDESLANTLQKTLGPLKLTLQSRVLFEERDGKRVLVIKGSANRNLDNVFSFVPDDGFGQASLVTQRKFELVLTEGYEINTLLSGMPILMSVQTSTGSPNSFVAQISIAPSFANFQGSSQVFVKTAIEPTFIRSDVDNLRYRGGAKITGGAIGLSVATVDGSDPVVSQIDSDEFGFDWVFDTFRLAADPASDKVQFVADRATGADLNKTATIDIRVNGLDITTADPYEVWHKDCDADVWQCIQDTPAPQSDLGHCGTYRDVLRCVHLDSCQVFGFEPLSLAATDSSALDPAVDSFNDGCVGGGDWCSVSSVESYDVGACSETPFGLMEIVDIVNAASQEQPQGGWGGQLLDVTQLAGTPLFGTSYSSGGPVLLEALHDFAASEDVQAWYFVEEAPCQNCHDFWTKTVLFYPATGRVLVVNGSYGYDS